MENKTLNKLLKQLPKKYHDRVSDFTEENGLIDNCKYILKWSDNYTDGEYVGSTYPATSYKDAIDYIKYALRDITEERKALFLLAEEIYDNSIKHPNIERDIDLFINNNINKSIEEIMNDYNILVNKDYNDKSILYLSYNDVNHMDFSCKRIIFKIRG